MSIFAYQQLGRLTLLKLESLADNYFYAMRDKGEFERGRPYRLAVNFYSCFRFGPYFQALALFEKHFVDRIDIT